MSKTLPTEDLERLRGRPAAEPMDPRLREDDAAGRFKAYLRRALFSEGQAADMLKCAGQFVHLMATVLHRNRDLAPNHLTISYHGNGDDTAYELTIRRCDGLTPADRIADLEAQVERLRSQVLWARQALHRFGLDDEAQAIDAIADILGVAASKEGGV